MSLMSFGKRLMAALAFVCLSHAAVAQVGAGTYTGTYSGNDHGSATVAIDQYGGVACTFVSAAGNGTFIASGGVISTSPFIISCSSTNYPFLRAASVSATAGGTITGQYGAQLNASSPYFSGNFTVAYSSASTGGGTTTSGSVNYQTVSGWWYDPSFTGSGFNLTGSSAGMLVAFYGFNAKGSQMWLTGVGPTSMKIGTPYSITLDINSTGTFTKPLNNAVSWGTLTLTFKSCTSATAVLSGSDGTVTQNIVMLAGVAGVPGC